MKFLLSFVMFLMIAAIPVFLIAFVTNASESRASSYFFDNKETLDLRLTTSVKSLDSYIELSEDNDLIETPLGGLTAHDCVFRRFSNPKTNERMIVCVGDTLTVIFSRPD
jgi:hypothetical protein